MRWLAVVQGCGGSHEAQEAHEIDGVVNAEGKLLHYFCKSKFEMKALLRITQNPLFFLVEKFS